MDQKKAVQVMLELLATIEASRDVARQHELESKSKADAYDAVLRDLRCDVNQVEGFKPTS